MSWLQQYHLVKAGFVPAPQQPSMDPAAAGMDPAAAGMDPAAAGMDPAAAGMGQEMDPQALISALGAGQQDSQGQVTINIQDLVTLIQGIAGAIKSPRKPAEPQEAQEAQGAQSTAGVPGIPDLTQALPTTALTGQG
jgi:hypothetical protein